MKKLFKALIATAAVAALVGVLLSAAYTQTVSEELARLRRESRSDVVYLRNRVRDLENELKASIFDFDEDSADTEITEETEAQTDPSAEETLADTAGDADVNEEEVTIPTHNSPETQAPSEETSDAAASVEADTSAAAYLLTVHDDVIGVFDGDGELVRTVNVFVMTLPEAEQKALAVGILANSEEELLALLEQYE